MTRTWSRQQALRELECLQGCRRIGAEEMARRRWRGGDGVEEMARRNDTKRRRGGGGSGGDAELHEQEGRVRKNGVMLLSAHCDDLTSLASKAAAYRSTDLQCANKVVEGMEVRAAMAGWGGKRRGR